MKLLPAIALALVLSSTLARAHDIWLTMGGSPSRIFVNYGHPTDRSPPEAEKILDLVAITPEKTVSLIDDLTPTETLGKPVLATKPVELGSVLLVARYDNGFFVKTPNGYRNTSKRLFPNATDSVWSIKFAKTILGPAAPWDRVVGQDLELVPLTNPAVLAVGAQLRVRLLFLGKPIGGAAVERGDGVTPMAEKDIPTFKTDADGVAVIPIEKPGPQLLAIDYPVKPSGIPELADADLYNASLFFEVRP